MLVARKFIREKLVDRGWARLVTDRIHVVPKNDRKDHKDGIDCWCIPDVKDGGELVVHNALDGRERYEGGN